MLLLIISLISYLFFIALFLTALIIFKVQDKRDISIRDIIMLLFWPLTIFRGLLNVLDDNIIDTVEIIAITNTVVFWVTFLSWLAL